MQAPWKRPRSCSVGSLWRLLYDWLSHWPLVTEATTSPSPFPENQGWSWNFQPCSHMVDSYRKPVLTIRWGPKATSLIWETIVYFIHLINFKRFGSFEPETVNEYQNISEKYIGIWSSLRWPEYISYKSQYHRDKMGNDTNRVSLKYVVYSEWETSRLFMLLREIENYSIKFC